VQEGAAETVPAAGGVAVGVGAGAPLTMIGPPGATTSSAPQPANASALQPARIKLRGFLTIGFPHWRFVDGGSASRAALGAGHDSLFSGL
jgi:hypothetical protein